MLKVLFVDNEKFWHEQVDKICCKDVQVLHAYDLATARRLFLEHHDIDVVVVDDCLTGSEVDTLEFVQEIKRGFAGRVVAACSNCNNGELLVGAGCEKQIYKSAISEFLLPSCA